MKQMKWNKMCYCTLITRSLFFFYVLQIFSGCTEMTTVSSVSLSAMVSTSVMQLRFNFNLSCLCSVTITYSFPHTIISNVFGWKESYIWQTKESRYRDKSLASRESYIVPLLKPVRIHQTVYWWREKEMRFEEKISRFANELGNWP